MAGRILFEAVLFVTRFKLLKESTGFRVEFACGPVVGRVYDIHRRSGDCGHRGHAECQGHEEANDREEKAWEVHG